MQDARNDTANASHPEKLSVVAKRVGRFMIQGGKKGRRRRAEFEIKISGPSNTEDSGAQAFTAGVAAGPSWPVSPAFLPAYRRRAGLRGEKRSGGAIGGGSFVYPVNRPD